MSSSDKNRKISRRSAIQLCVGATAIPTAAYLYAQSPTVRTWSIDGTSRKAIVVAPASAKSTAGPGAPLIFAFHGAGDTMENFSGVAFEEAWPEAIVVYPQGLPRAGMLGGGVWQIESGQNGDRDVKFFDQMLSTLRAEYRVDPARTYASGFSNGAKLTYLLWAVRPEIFAALGPVAGQHAPSLHITKPIPLIHTAGQNDHQNEYELQVASIAMAKQVNKAEGQGNPCGKNCTEYSSALGTPVRTIIHRGGHVYPAGTTLAITNFFKTHPKTKY